jgi:general secretion pathway protein D
VISFLNNDTDAKVLSTPRTITLDNEPAILSVTVSNPVVNQTASVAGVTSGSQQTTYVETGTKLTVTPRISANDLIRLAVEPSVSKNDGPLPSTQANGQPPQDSYSFRKITTQVLIPSGNTLVMGGLVSEDINNTYSKVPILGDIPLVGLAFRHESKERRQKNLIIFITPTIVQDSDFQPTTTDYLKTPLPKSESTQTKISAWDSGMPYDWSKPKANKAPVFK